MRPYPTCCALLLIGLAALAGACRRPVVEKSPPPVTFSGPTMGTWFTVKVVDPPKHVEPETLEREILDTLARLEALMSTYDPGSELSRLNRFEGPDWFDVSPQTAAVVDEALRIGELTGGAFDVTVAPLVSLWNFGPVKRTNDRVPTDAEIEALKARVGFRQVEVRRSPPGVRKEREDVSIDLSGIAKGFAVDHLAEHLEHRGIRDYMVDVGGEVKARGRNPRGKPWQIAVESPLVSTREIQRVIPLDGLAVATSGDYRNYFEQDGVRYCHILDPRSGRPITHKLASVSVLDPSCMRADALATALMVLGPEAGYNFAREHELAVCFLVNSDTGFVEKTTPPFEQVLKQ
ncbi:MAG TPA: FAD:protein FMN transferase [Thermoguttaceae bacterium]|nr:FAD:protein FMN transferase [Thermoguttaceae bacterium]